MPPYNGKYVANADLAAEFVGGAFPASITGAQQDNAIKQAERMIEGWCGRWFYPLATVLTLDGGPHYFPQYFSLAGLDSGSHTFLLSGLVENSDTILLNIPIITLTNINIFGVDRDLVNAFLVPNRVGPPVDDRWNPRIISKYAEFPMYGIQNIVLTGTFGFCEADGATPPELIRIAARKQALRLLPWKQMTDGERDMFLNASHINSEQLPGYKYTMHRGYREDSNNVRYSGDTEIDDIVEEYRYKKFSCVVA